MRGRSRFFRGGMLTLVVGAGSQHKGKQSCVGSPEPTAPLRHQPPFESFTLATPLPTITGDHVVIERRSSGFAVVKTEAALALREAGIARPVYLMARFPKSAAADLARHDVQPCLYSDDAVDLVAPMARVRGGPVPAQAYLDTGMSRMGVPYHRALPWVEALVRSGRVSIRAALEIEPELRRVSRAMRAQGKSTELLQSRHGRTHHRARNTSGLSREAALRSR